MASNNPFADRINQAAKEGYVNGTRYAYREYAAPNRGMSDKQFDLILSLLSERDLTAETRPKFRARTYRLAQNHDEIRELSREKASALITYLFGLPQASGAANTPEVPAGRYAVEQNGTVVFLQVDCPNDGKWAGKVFVKLQHGDEFTNMSREAGSTMLGRIIEQGVKESMLRYGKLIGHCGAPGCGRTLTHPFSRQLGIGPVCMEKMGW